MQRVQAGISSAIVATFVRVSSVMAGGDETIIVTTLNDTVDFGGTQQISDLPGPDGEISFREACAAVNHTPGEHTIGFNIPQDEWWLYDDRALLRLEDGVFSISRDGTTIDGTTQTDFTGDTNPNGWELGIYGLQPNGWGAPAIVISADNCTVMGFDRVMQRGHAIDISGHDNRVINNTISGPLHTAVRIYGGFDGPAATGNIVGGTGPNEGNILSGGNAGVSIEGPAENNIVIGNRLSGGSLGIRIIGSQYTDYARNNRLGGPTPAERNIISGAGSYCCEGAPSGAQVAVTYAIGTIIEGNYIGTTPDGMATASQLGPVGVDVFDSQDTIVRDNLISGIRAIGVNHYAGDVFGVGINVRGVSTNTTIQGNMLGTNAAGLDALPNYRSIVVQQFGIDGTPVDALIGGLDAEDANLIAHGEVAGVVLSGNVSGITISGNSIRSNGDAGITLLGGANGSQPAPILDDAVVSGTTIDVAGTLSGVSGELYRLEFFANEACDPSGAGEGEIFLGHAEVTAADGATDFNVSIEDMVNDGQVITATATRLSTGNTSVFSTCVSVEVVPGNPADLNGDGTINVADLLILLGAWGECDAPANCPADLTDDGSVGVSDLLALLAKWG